MRGRTNTTQNKSKESPKLAAKLLRLVIFVIVPLLAAGLFVITVRNELQQPIDPKSEEKIIVEVPQGASFSTVAKNLEKRGLIRRWWVASTLARIKGLDTKLTAGEYEISPAMSLLAIIKRLLSGEKIQRKVTLREGISLKEIPELFAAAGLASSQEMKNHLSNPQLPESLGISAPSLEGYIFPSTYFFSRPLDPKEAVTTMVKEGLKRWTQERARRAQELHLSRHQILTLASIIERESGNFAEQPLISSVFHNRLKYNMRLQSDPTVIYGILDFDGNLTKAHLQQKTPYNTYVIKGLPPTPICNPGESAIDAALNPKESTFLYFVADGQGSHIFSSNIADHNRAVATYQKAPRKSNTAE